MRRNLPVLEEKAFDLVVVGGGIFGICAAWEAVLRGLSVALVEQKDFAHATSANCFKIVHGGIRYLQHADLIRIRQSSKERNVLLRIAPHLVQPLPIVIPTYGHGKQGKEFLKVGLTLYDLITFDRNKGIKDPARKIPNGKLISRERTLELFPGLKEEGLTGAAIFYDGHMYSPPRLALSFLRSAVGAGVVAANYVEAIGFLRSGSRVTGIQARDSLTGNELEIRGKVTLNAAGPWAESLLGERAGIWFQAKGTYSRDACFVVPRRFFDRYAVAVQGRTKDPDAVLSRNARHLFIVPWRDCTLIGVWHVVHRGGPDTFTVTQEDLQGFLDEVNEAYPSLQLTIRDVTMWHAGLVPFGDNEPGAKDLSYGKRSRLVDHGKTDGVEGLLTLIGVRYTTARGEASRAIDLVCKKLDQPVPKSMTEETPIYGGDIDRFDDLFSQAMAERPSGISSDAIRALIHNYGSQYRKVLNYLEEDPTWVKPVGQSHTIQAEVVHAIREEMAQKMTDVVLRRTDLGTGGYPGEEALHTCADLMGDELGWDLSTRESELEEVKANFPSFRGMVKSGVGT